MAASTNNRFGRLKVFQQSTGGKCTKLQLWNTTMSIGSDLNATVRLVRPGVEALHCELRVREDGLVTLFNKSKQEPVRINDHEVIHPMCLLPNDEFSIVGKKFLYQNAVLPPDLIDEARKQNIEALRKMKRITTVVRQAFTPQPTKADIPRPRRTSSLDNMRLKQDSDELSSKTLVRESQKPNLNSSENSETYSPYIAKTSSRITNGFVVSTPESTAKPSLRNTRIFTKESDPESEESSSNVDRQEILKTPLLESMIGEDVITTPLNNTSLITVQSSQEEGTRLRSRKCKSKDISIQRLTNNDDSVIVLDSPSSKTPKSALKSKFYEIPMSGIKGKLLDLDTDNEEESQESSVIAIDDSNVSQLTPEETFDSQLESGKENVKPSRRSERGPRKAFEEEPKRDSDVPTNIDVDSSFITEAATSVDSPKKLHCSTPAPSKLIHKVDKDISFKYTDNDDTNMSSQEQESSTTTDSDLHIGEKRKRDSNTPIDVLKKRQKMVLNDSTLPEMKLFTSEDNEQTSLEDDTSLIKTPLVNPNVSKRNAFTEPKQQKNTSNRRSLSLRSSNQENEVILESNNTTVETIDTSSFVYVKNNVSFEHAQFGSPTMDELVAKSQKKPLNDLSDFTGVKQLMKTPRVQKEPLNDISSPRGLKQLMKTPKTKVGIKNDLSNMSGVKEHMNTPGVVKESESENQSEEAVISSFNISGIDTLLDEDDIFPRRKATRTYGRSLTANSTTVPVKMSRKTELYIPNVNPDVAKWLEDATTSASPGGNTDNEESVVIDSVDTGDMEEDSNETVDHNVERNDEQDDDLKMSQVVSHEVPVSATRTSMRRSVMVEVEDNSNMRRKSMRQSSRQSAAILIEDTRDVEQSALPVLDELSGRKSMRRISIDKTEPEADAVKSTRKSMKKSVRQTVTEISEDIESDTETAESEVAVSEDVCVSAENIADSPKMDESVAGIIEKLDESVVSISDNPSDNEVESTSTEVEEYPIRSLRKSMRKSAIIKDSSSDTERKESPVNSPRKSLKSAPIVMSAGNTNDSIEDSMTAYYSGEESLIETHETSAVAMKDVSKHNELEDLDDVDSENDAPIDDEDELLQSSSESDAVEPVPAPRKSTMKSMTIANNSTAVEDSVKLRKSVAFAIDPVVSHKNDSNDSGNIISTIPNDNDGIETEDFVLAVGAREEEVPTLSTRKSIRKIVSPEDLPTKSPRKSTRKLVEPETSPIESDAAAGCTDTETDPAKSPRKSMRKPIVTEDVSNESDQDANTTKMDENLSRSSHKSKRKSGVAKVLRESVDTDVPTDFTYVDAGLAKSPHKLMRKSIVTEDISNESDQGANGTEMDEHLIMSSRKSMRTSGVAKVIMESDEIEVPGDYTDVEADLAKSPRKSMRKSVVMDNVSIESDEDVITTEIDEDLGKTIRKSGVAKIVPESDETDVPTDTTDVDAGLAKSPRKSMKKSVVIEDVSIESGEDANTTEKDEDLVLFSRGSINESMKLHMSTSINSTQEASIDSDEVVENEDHTEDASDVEDDIATIDVYAERDKSTRKSMRKSVAIDVITPNDDEEEPSKTASKSMRKSSVLSNILDVEETPEKLSRKSLRKTQFSFQVSIRSHEEGEEPTYSGRKSIRNTTIDSPDITEVQENSSSKSIRKPRVTNVANDVIESEGDEEEHQIDEDLVKSSSKSMKKSVAIDPIASNKGEEESTKSSRKSLKETYSISNEATDTHDDNLAKTPRKSKKKSLITANDTILFDEAAEEPKHSSRKSMKKSSVLSDTIAVEETLDKSSRKSIRKSVPANSIIKSDEDQEESSEIDEDLMKSSRKSMRKSVAIDSHTYNLDENEPTKSARKSLKKTDSILNEATEAYDNLTKTPRKSMKKLLIPANDTILFDEDTKEAKHSSHKSIKKSLDVEETPEKSSCKSIREFVVSTNGPETYKDQEEAGIDEDIAESSLNPTRKSIAIDSIATNNDDEESTKSSRKSIKKSDLISKDTTEEQDNQTKTRRSIITDSDSTSPDEDAEKLKHSSRKYMKMSGVISEANVEKTSDKSSRKSRKSTVTANEIQEPTRTRRSSSLRRSIKPNDVAENGLGQSDGIKEAARSRRSSSLITRRSSSLQRPIKPNDTDDQSSVNSTRKSVNSGDKSMRKSSNNTESDIILSTKTYITPNKATQSNEQHVFKTPNLDELTPREYLKEFLRKLTIPLTPLNINLVNKLNLRRSEANLLNGNDSTSQSLLNLEQQKSNGLSVTEPNADLSVAERKRSKKLELDSCSIQEDCLQKTTRLYKRVITATETNEDDNTRKKSARIRARLNTETESEEDQSNSRKRSSKRVNTETEPENNHSKQTARSRKRMNTETEATEVTPTQKTRLPSEVESAKSSTRKQITEGINESKIKVKRGQRSNKSVQDKELIDLNDIFIDQSESTTPVQKLRRGRTEKEIDVKVTQPTRILTRRGTKEESVDVKKPTKSRRGQVTAETEQIEIEQVEDTPKQAEKKSTRGRKGKKPTVEINEAKEDDKEDQVEETPKNVGRTGRGTKEKAMDVKQPTRGRRVKASVKIEPPTEEETKEQEKDTPKLIEKKAARRGRGKATKEAEAIIIDDEKQVEEISSKEIDETRQDDEEDQEEETPKGVGHARRGTKKESMDVEKPTRSRRGKVSGEIEQQTEIETIPIPLENKARTNRRGRGKPIEKAEGIIVYDDTQVEDIPKGEIETTHIPIEKKATRGGKGRPIGKAKVIIVNDDKQEEDNPKGVSRSRRGARQESADVKKPTRNRKGKASVDIEQPAEEETIEDDDTPNPAKGNKSKVTEEIEPKQNPKATRSRTGKTIEKNEVEEKTPTPAKKVTRGRKTKKDAVETNEEAAAESPNPKRRRNARIASTDNKEDPRSLNAKSNKTQKAVAHEEVSEFVTKTTKAKGVLLTRIMPKKKLVTFNPPALLSLTPDAGKLKRRLQSEDDLNMEVIEPFRKTRSRK